MKSILRGKRGEKAFPDTQVWLGVVCVCVRACGFDFV